MSVLCFYGCPYFLVHTKMQVSVQKYAAGAGSLAAGQNITYPHDKGCCFTRNLLQFLLNQEVIKEHMPHPLHPPPPPPLNPFLSGPDGRTASVSSTDASVDPGCTCLSESETLNQWRHCVCCLALVFQSARLCWRDQIILGFYIHAVSIQSFSFSVWCSINRTKPQIDSGCLWNSSITVKLKMQIQYVL